MSDDGSIADFIGDQLLEEVNVFNETNRQVEGEIQVVDPGGDTALDDTFDVHASDSDENSNTVTYSDVWTDTGEYTVGQKY